MSTATTALALLTQESQIKNLLLLLRDKYEGSRARVSLEYDDDMRISFSAWVSYSNRKQHQHDHGNEVSPMWIMIGWSESICRLRELVENSP